VAYFLFLRFAARITGRLFTVHDRAQSGGRMQRTKTGGAYDWDLDYPSPSMLRVYVFLVDWRVAVAVTTRLVWVFKPKGRMQRTKTGGAYDWDLDYPSPLMLRVYVFLVDWRVAVAVTTRFVWVFKVGTRSRLRLQLRLLRCLPKRLTAVMHRRAEFLRPSPSVLARGLRCGGVCGRERGGGGAGGGGGVG